MRNSGPLISIIIPCHNYAHTLTETLNSIKHQTLSSWEAIIVNDGSTDNTSDVIAYFSLVDKRFIEIHQQQKGVSAARNAGMKAAKGEYILFLDADDLITPHKLESHKRHFESDRNIDTSYSYCQYFHTSNPEELFPSFDLTNKEWMPITHDSIEAPIKELMTRNLFVISSPVIKRSALPSSILFNERMKFYEDWLFWFSCATAGLSFHYCRDKECATLIRVHDISAAQNKEKMFEGIPFLRQEMMKSVESSKNIGNERLKKLKKENARSLKKWCRKKIKKSGASPQTLKEMIGASDKKTAYFTTARYIIKNPIHFFTTFFRPR